MKTALALSLFVLSLGCTGQIVSNDDPVISAPTQPSVQAGSCTTEWCVSAVLQDAGDLQSVWAASANDAWAVDFFGHTYRWNGASWIETQTAAGFYSVSGVWGTSSSDVWVDGDFGIEHFDGTSWSITPSPGYLPLQGMWGSGPNDVWALGGGFTLEHWNGTQWSKTVEEGRCCDFTHAWGATSNDVWATSDEGIAHWDGTSWTFPERFLSQNVEGIWGFAANDIWTVGQFGMIGHYDGTKWSEVRAAANSQSELMSVWGASPNDVWAVGAKGTILHWDGAQWSDSSSGVTTLLEGIHGTSAGDVWVVGMNVILHSASAR